MKSEESAQAILLEMLEVAELKKKASYTPAEVCALLDIAPRTFWRYVSNYEPDEKGNPTHPATLYSFMLRSERRVPFMELVRYIQRNDTYQRRYGVNTDQLALFN